MTEQEFRHRVLPLQRAMYGIALRMGIPPDDAADAVQETLLRLWRRREGIPPDPGQSRMYCLAAFRNECVSQLRRSHPSVPLEEAAEIRGEETEETEYRDTRRHIEILIDSLPRGQRRAVRLSSFGGLDNTEIAVATGQTENNVRQLLSRGRRRLRDLIEKNLKNLSS